MTNKDNLKNQTISALFYSFGGFIVNSGIQFILGIILARLLLPQDYGLLGMIMVLLAVSQIFIDGGMTTALIREKEVSNEDYSTVFYYNLILAILMYVLLFLSANFISGFFREPSLVPIIRVIGLNLIIGSFGLIQRTMLTKRLDFKTQTKIDAISSILAGILAIYFAYNGYGVWALVIQQILLQLTSSVLFMVHNKWIPLRIFNWDSFKMFFSFGWKMLLTGLLSTLYHNIYNLIIGRVYLSTQLGYYTKAKQFSEFTVNSITTATTKVAYPVLSNIQDDKELFRGGFKKIIKSLSFLIFPIMIGLIAVAEPLILILFGINWLPMVPYFRILCLSGITFPHRALNLNILQVKGRSDLFLGIDILNIIIGLLSIAIVIVLNLGIYGLLWSIVLNTLIAFFTSSYFSKTLILYSTKEQLKDMIPTIISATLMGIIVYITGIVVPIGIFAQLVVQICVGIISFIVISKLFKIQELNTVFQLIQMGIKRYN